MSRRKATALGLVIIPASAFVYFVGLLLIFGASISDVLRGATAMSAFGLPVTIPIGALLGHVLSRLVTGSVPRSRVLLSLPIGFVAGAFIAYSWSPVFGLVADALNAIRSFSWTPLFRGVQLAYPSASLGVPMWLYASLVSYAFASFLRRRGSSKAVAAVPHGLGA